MKTINEDTWVVSNKFMKISQNDGNDPNRKSTQKLTLIEITDNNEYIFQWPDGTKTCALTREEAENQFAKIANESMWSQLKQKVNEVKKIQVKRKYTELHPALHVGHLAKVRNEVIGYLGKNQMMTEEEFDDLLTQVSIQPSLWKKRNFDIYEKNKNGYIVLTKRGKRILSGLSVNESNKLITKSNEVGIVVIYDNQILLMHPDKEKMDTNYIIPKGKIKHNENINDAAIRVFFDVTGIKLNKNMLSKPKQIIQSNQTKLFYFVIHINELSELKLRFPNLSPHQLDLDYFDSGRFVNKKLAATIMDDNMFVFLSLIKY